MLDQLGPRVQQALQGLKDLLALTVPLRVHKDLKDLLALLALLVQPVQ